MSIRARAAVPETAQHGGLLEALVAELRAPHDSRQPIITEDHRVRKGIVHVQVIWDRWQECPEVERWQVIQEAYRLAKGEQFANQIRLATGFTMSEAASIGLLPYQVVPRRHPSGALTPEQYASAMIGEGASVLEDRANPMLRFEALEDAEACQQRLERRLPGSHWSIIQDLGMQ